MSNKLTDVEIKTLRKNERWCYDTMNYPSISPRVFTILLDNYDENNGIKRED